MHSYTNKNNPATNSYPRNAAKPMRGKHSIKRTAYTKRISKLPKLKRGSSGCVIVSQANLDLAIEYLPESKFKRKYLSVINSCPYEVCWYENETLRQKMKCKSVSTVKRANRSLNGKWVEVNPGEGDGYMEKSGFVCRTSNVYVLKVEALLQHAEMLEESLKPRRIATTRGIKMPPPPLPKCTPKNPINKHTNINIKTSLLLSPKKGLREVSNCVSFSEAHEALKPIYDAFDRIHSQGYVEDSRKSFTKMLLRKKIVKTPKQLFEKVSEFKNTNAFIDRSEALKEPNCDPGGHSYGRLLNPDALVAVCYAKRPKANMVFRGFMDKVLTSDEKDLPRKAVCVQRSMDSIQTAAEILAGAYPEKYSLHRAQEAVNLFLTERDPLRVLSKKEVWAC